MQQTTSQPPGAGPSQDPMTRTLTPDTVPQAMPRTAPIVVQKLRYIPLFFSDDSLTKKASLNAVAACLDYAARLLVGFLTTPLLVAGLGDFYFGVWRMLLSLVGYVSPASGRPTQALKMVLANQQSSTDYDKKRRYVGSALAVWAMFLPLMLVLGGLLTWFAPRWVKSPAGYFGHVRFAAALLVANLAVATLVALPQSVLEGENRAYKRMGLSALLTLLGGGIIWLVLHLKMGIVGVAGATLATTLMTGLFFLQVARTYAPWFGIAMPDFQAARQFLNLSWWFLAWNLIMNLMMASDIVVLGFLDSVQAVTDYSLCKYAPETLVSLVAIMAFGIAPGLGGIIGAGSLQKAARVREEIMSLTWLTVTILGFTVLLWNRSFLRMWVGAGHYVGTLPSLLIIVVVMQFVLIRNDGNFIDLTLRLRDKVLMGGLSVTISLIAAALLVGYFRLGIVGLSAGLILGRSILTFGYPMLVGRHLRISLWSQVRGALRPFLVTSLLFALASVLDSYSFSGMTGFGRGWFGLALSVGITTVSSACLAFYLGLSPLQRSNLLQRVSYVLAVGNR